MVGMAFSWVGIGGMRYQLPQEIQKPEDVRTGDLFASIYFIVA